MTDPFARRLADWRCQQVVYQVFVDRFAIGRPVAQRRQCYGPSALVKRWDARPAARSRFVGDTGNRRHELEFWGGDLVGLQAHLDHIQSLGANVVYLNPVFEALTNHKYDPTDPFRIDPVYGTQADFEALCGEIHRRGMRIVLDGVFNHTGSRSPWFQAAIADPESPWRQFYDIDPRHPNGYRAWRDVPSLPELRLENPNVQGILFGNPDSIVRHWLAWTDGWRLDVANDLGPEILAGIVRASHESREDSLVVGELYNYPAGWSSVLDGVLNLFLRATLVALLEEKVSGPQAGRIIERMVADCGMEPLLRAWTVLANHDLPRLAHVFPSLPDRIFLWSLMATLPGAPLIWQGEELGLRGGMEPESREPMDWEAATRGTPEITVMKTLLGLRNRMPALKVGDHVAIETRSLFAFARRMHRPLDTVIVVANPTSRSICEPICPRDPWLMDTSSLVEALTGETRAMATGYLWPEVPPRTVQIWTPKPEPSHGYRAFKRVP